MTEGSVKPRTVEEEGAGFSLPPPIAGEWRQLDEAMEALLLARLKECHFPDGPDLGNGAAVRLLSLPFWPGWFLCDIQPNLPDGTKADRATASVGPDVAGGDGWQDPTGTNGPGLEAGTTDTEDEDDLADNIVDLAERRMSKDDGSADPMPDGAIYSYAYGPDGFLPLTGSSLPVHAHNQRHGVVLDDADVRAQYLRFFCYFVRGDAGPFEIVETPDRVASTNGETSGLDAEAVAERPKETKTRKDGATVLSATLVYSNALFGAEFAIRPGGMVEMLDDNPIRENVMALPPTGFRGAGRFPLPPVDENAEDEE